MTDSNYKISEKDIQEINSKRYERAKQIIHNRKIFQFSF